MTDAPPTLAAFLRGLNVGGHRVRMDRLRDILSNLGLGDPRTLLASGNVVFDTDTDDTDALERRLEEGLRDALGYDVDTFVRSGPEVTRIASDPFPGVNIGEDHRIHVIFLKRPAPPEAIRGMRELVPPGDVIEADAREIYWLRRGRLMEADLSDPGKLRGTHAGTATMRTMNTIRRLASKFFSD